MSTLQAPVPPASVTVSDALLQTAIETAAAFEAGTPEAVDETAGAIFLAIARPVLEECLRWRQRAGLIRDLAAPDNVILLTGR